MIVDLVQKLKGLIQKLSGCVLIQMTRENVIVECERVEKKKEEKKAVLSIPCVSDNYFGTSILIFLRNSIVYCGQLIDVWSDS